MSIRFPINLRWLVKVEPEGKSTPADDSGVKIAGFTVVENFQKVLLVFRAQAFYLIPNQEIINVIWSFENGSSKQYSKDEIKRITGESDIRAISSSLMKLLNSQKQRLEQKEPEITASCHDEVTEGKASETDLPEFSDFPSDIQQNPGEIPAYLDEFPHFEEMS